MVTSRAELLHKKGVNGKSTPLVLLIKKDLSVGDGDIDKCFFYVFNV